MKKEEKKYDLLKGILFLVVVAIILSWLIPYGEFKGTSFTSEGALARIGLNSIAEIFYYSIQFAMDKIVLLIAIAGFYGVLSKTKAYDNLVTNIAKKIKHKKIFVVTISCLFAVLTSLFRESFASLIFIPFIISIMNRMKIDKMTIITTTFGSVLLGVLGATFGTEGLRLIETQGFFTADSFDPNKTVLIRAGILLISLVLFNFLNVAYMKKKSKENETVDMFPVVEADEKKKTKFPIIVMGIILIILVILGFLNWNTWNITIFDDFHTLVTDIKIGDDFYIFSNILGSTFVAFGKWDLLTLSSIIILFTIIIGLCYRFKFNEFVSSYINGIKKIIKPIFAIIGAFTVMTIVYMSPMLPTIANKILSLTKGFNIATTSLSLIISYIFSSNLDFVGYSFFTYFVSAYPSHLNTIYVMISSLFGLVSFIAPTSLILVVGLTSLDIKYKEWLKYIWKFLVGITICLLVIFILMTLI